MNFEALKNTLFENVHSTNDQFRKHFHDTYTIGITNDGLFKSINSNKTFLSYKNSVRIINPGEVHGGTCELWKYTNFYPSVELLVEIYEEIYFERKIPVFEKHIIDDILLFKLLNTLFYDIYTKQDNMKIEIRLIDALSHLIKNYTYTTKDYDTIFDDTSIINKSLEYINDTINTNISLDDLAKVTNTSKYHFLRIFKKELGLTPHNYILTQKIQKATKQILNGSSIVDASSNFAFSDQSHFTRNFKRMYGYTPKTIVNNSNIILYK